MTHIASFAAELRKHWSFDRDQVHTHSWHSREDFIEQRLPELLEQPEVDRLTQIIREAYRRLSCVAIERSLSPEIAQTCDRQAMEILSHGLTAKGKA